MARYKTVVTPDGQTNVEITGDELAALEAAEAAFEAGRVDRAMRNMRQQRNHKLAETDWSQGADVPDALKTKYTEYRQALRDITKTYSSYEDVVWPTKPE